MSFWPGTPRPQRRSSPLYLSPSPVELAPWCPIPEVTPVRLWPRKGVKARVRLEQLEARAQIEQSRAAGRRVDARGPAVHRMNRLLDFYSDRNGFADAFEQMIEQRGRHRASGG